MTNTQVSVPGVHCDHCKMSIEGALTKAAGVNDVEVSLTDRQVTVTHDPAVTGIEEIVGLIEDQGYDVESFKEVPA